MRNFSYLTTLLTAATIGRADTDRLLAASRQVAVHLAAARAVKATQATSSVADVVAAATTFMGMLSTSQQSTVLQAFNATNVTKWSNLPIGAAQRLGIRLDALSSSQVAAALAVVQAATGTPAGEGFNEIQQIRAADDNLGTQQAGYGNKQYYIAFLGTPSTTGTWMLQFGGHHLATNITFVNGAVAGATPKFEGLEPLTFTTTNADVLPAGTACAPLSSEQSTMLALFNSLTTAQKATAKLSQTFTDIVLGPGQDGKFPLTRVGLPGSQLTSAQQALVVAAMAPWVQDSDDATAAFLLGKYQAALADTYISYSGSGSFTAYADYARIDGPNVWIEFLCQNGNVYPAIHYHTLWRDRARDYGGNFYTTALATKAATAGEVFSVYPNPAATGGAWRVQLAEPAATATYSVRNSLGQKVKAGSISGSSGDIATSDLAPGLYSITVATPTQLPATTKVLLN